MKQIVVDRSETTHGVSHCDPGGLAVGCGLDA